MLILEKSTPSSFWVIHAVCYNFNTLPLALELALDPRPLAELAREPFPLLELAREEARDDAREPDFERERERERERDRPEPDL